LFIFDGLLDNNKNNNNNIMGLEHKRRTVWEGVIRRRRRKGKDIGE
jgi:hypothetical protein